MALPVVLIRVRSQKLITLVVKDSDEDVQVKCENTTPAQEILKLFKSAYVHKETRIVMPWGDRTTVGTLLKL